MLGSCLAPILSHNHCNNSRPQNAERLTPPLLQEVTQASLSTGNMREEQRAKVFFTDDLAPVEQLIDLIIFNAARTGQE